MVSVDSGMLARSLYLRATLSSLQISNATNSLPKVVASRRVLYKQKDAAVRMSRDDVAGMVSVNES